MAYKTFANGFPLPASDLNNFLMNQSVIVFADSAARTTAIPSPVEGMLTYLEDTNAYESWNGSAYVALVEDPDLTSLIPKSTVTTAQDLIVADGASSVTRLGVGTDDQVLSVVAGSVAWADAGGGGAGDWTQIVTSASVTGAVDYTITGLSGYADYYFEFLYLSSTAVVALFTISEFNGSVTGNSIAHVEINQNQSSGVFAFPNTSCILGRVGTSSGFFVHAATQIFGANSTAPAIIDSIGGSSHSDSGNRAEIAKGRIDKDNLALSSIKIAVSNGTFDNGTVSVWAR